MRCHRACGATRRVVRPRPPKAGINSPPDASRSACGTLHHGANRSCPVVNFSPVKQVNIKGRWYQTSSGPSPRGLDTLETEIKQPPCARKQDGNGEYYESNDSPPSAGINSPPGASRSACGALHHGANRSCPVVNFSPVKQVYIIAGWYYMTRNAGRRRPSLSRRRRRQIPEPQIGHQHAHD